MQGIGLARQIHGFAFKKSELKLGRQTVKKKKKNYTGINAMGCYRNTKMKHLALDGKYRTPAKASSAEFGQGQLASLRSQV